MGSEFGELYSAALRLFLNETTRDFFDDSEDWRL